MIWPIQGIAAAARRRRASASSATGRCSSASALPSWASILHRRQVARPMMHAHELPRHGRRIRHSTLALPCAQDLLCLITCSTATICSWARRYRRIFLWSTRTYSRMTAARTTRDHDDTTSSWERRLERRTERLLRRRVARTRTPMRYAACEMWHHRAMARRANDAMAWAAAHDAARDAQLRCESSSSLESPPRFYWALEWRWWGHMATCRRYRARRRQAVIRV